MALIKHANANRLLNEAIVLDLGDLNRQAEAIMSRAREQAARILAQSKAEAQKLIEGAAAVGHAEGFEKGAAEGRVAGEQQASAQTLELMSERLQALTDSWIQALSRWEADRAQMLLAAREDVLLFAFALAEKLVYRIIRTDPLVVQEQLAEALGLLSRPTSVEIAVNPEDRATVEQTLPGLIAHLGTCKEARIREDAGMMRGGCIVQTANGRIDATIETQLDRIARTLLPDRGEAAEAGEQPQVTQP
jgi:flagellar assembly protein FliH